MVVRRENDLMEQRLIKFLEIQDELKKDLKTYVVNKQIPLFIRWSLFIKADLGEEMYYIPNMDTVDMGMIGEEPFIHKYETIHMDWLVDWLYHNDQYIIAEGTNIDQKIDAVKEEILSRFLKSFELDW